MNAIHRSIFGAMAVAALLSQSGCAAGYPAGSGPLASLRAAVSPAPAADADAARDRDAEVQTVGYNELQPASQTLPSQQAATAPVGLPAGGTYSEATMQSLARPTAASRRVQAAGCSSYG